MASSCSNHFLSGFSTLSLTLEEMQLPPWEQIMHNGALDPFLVRPSSSGGSSVREAESEQEEDFSDDDLSDLEHFTCGRKLARNDPPVLELRKYQEELAENALQGDNTIICAPTGSGKTRVATYIILEHLKNAKVIEKKVAFIAKTVPLAVQQYKAMRKYMPSHEIALLTGQNGESNILHFLLPFNDIIVMTPQILENHLTNKYLSNLAVFSMLIFDECHHTRKKDPYNVLMKSYLKMKDKISHAKESGKKVKFRLPQIIGLTATIGVDKAVGIKEASQNILKFCANLDVSNLSTVQRNIAELQQCVPVPGEKIIALRERDEDESALKLENIMEKLETQLRHLVEVELRNNGFFMNISKDLTTDRKSQVYEQWAVKARKDAKELEIRDPERETNMPVRLSIIILEYLIAYRAALETYDLVELSDVIGYLEKCFYEFQHQKGTTGETRFYTHFQELKKLVMMRHNEGNPNLRILAKVLKKYLVKKGDKSRGIIFVKTRALAEALSSWLNRCEISAIKNLKASSFTGSNVPEEKGGTSQAHQEAIIQRFKSGEIRILVATSVAEEGLDIPDCNLVVKYNHVGSEISTVQTRGRSRAFGGISVLLAMGAVLQREQMNCCRVDLMQKAIDKIQKMNPADFKKAVADHQKKILNDIKIAELVRKTSKKPQQQVVQFRVVCALCRKNCVDGTDVKIVSSSQYVSIDRNFLDHIEVIPDKQTKEKGDCLLVGTVLCKGEPEPGKKCKKKLGRIVKHMTIPFVALSIKSLVFDLGNQRPLSTWEKWKDVPFAIGNLSYDDIERYLKDDKVLPNLLPLDTELPMDNSEDDTSDDDSVDDNDDDTKNNTTPKKFL